MADSDQKTKRGGPNPAKRADDKRLGGNKPYDPEPNRERVELWAKVHSRREIYLYLLDISEPTFRKHHEKDYQRGLLETTSAVGANIIEKALKGDGPSQRYYMDRRGGWHGKLEHTGPDGGPIQHKVKPLDLSAYTDEQKILLIPLLEQLIADREAEEREDSEG